MEKRLFKLLGFPLCIEVEKGFLQACFFEDPDRKFSTNDFSPRGSQKIWAPVESFLEAYERGQSARVQNDLNALTPFMAPAPTSFGKRLRAFLLESLPWGMRETYDNVAKALSSGPRGVGQSLRANPLALFVPCHRIVGKESIGGFSGGPLRYLGIKKALLEHEKTFF